MPVYAVTGQTACDSTSDTCLNLFRGASKRIFLYDFTLGASGAPADNAILWIVQRTTGLGTEGTGSTPVPLDTADGVSVADAGQDYSAEPTYTSGKELFEQAINQRAAYRWVAAPGGQIVVPNTTDNGIGWQPSHASYAGNVEVTAHFTE